MASTFNDLPVELLGCVAEQLDLADIYSLRLVDRNAHAKASSSSFRSRCKSHCVSRRLRITTDNLTRLVCVTEPQALGCMLEDLTLAHGRESMVDSGDVTTNSKLLARAFTNLRTNSKSGRLRSLTLDYIPSSDKELKQLPPHDKWKPHWASATMLFQLTVQALGASGLPIQQFDVYHNSEGCDDDIREWRYIAGRLPADQFDPLNSSTNCSSCSLDASLLAPLLADSDLWLSFAGLERMSLSLSLGVNRDASDGHTVEDVHSDAIAQFIALAPNLHSLDLHWYNLWISGMSNLESRQRRFLDRAVASFPPSLTTCRLQGIYASASTLLQVLRLPKLRELTLDQFHLQAGGSFEPFFEEIAQGAVALEHLRVDTLWQVGRLLYFDAPSYSSVGSKMKTNYLQRGGARNEVELRKRIRYYYGPPSALVTSYARIQRERRQVRYGPPSIKVDGAKRKRKIKRYGET